MFLQQYTENKNSANFTGKKRFFFCKKKETGKKL